MRVKWEYYINRGNTYYFLGKYEEALKDYTRAIELDGGEAGYYANRGNAYYSLGRYEEALKDYTRAMELDRKEPIYYVNRGDTYYSLGRYEEAAKEYTKAIELDGKETKYYDNRGHTYLWLRNTQQAYTAFRHAMTLDARNLNAAWMAERSAFQKEPPVGGHIEKRLSEIVVMDPERYEYGTYLCRGILAGWQGNLRLGLQLIEQALSVEKLYEAYFWKGMLLANYYYNYSVIRHAEEITAAIEQALTLGMPPILLTPLYWLEKDKPEFFATYLKPILARYDV